jgi:hypothetical protein
MAASTCGLWAIPVNPRAAITMNHSNMIGPNALPIFSVPNLCAANSATRIATAMGITKGFRAAVATLTPSSALSTEMAGVMTPSPYNSAAPSNPIPVRSLAPLRKLFAPIRDINAKMPPSP